MTLDDFKKTLEEDQPPEQLSELLRSLWYLRKGDWHRAHGIAQSVPTRDGSWLHAHIHREEGDLGNARYWYDRADRPESKVDLGNEWEEIAQHLLSEL
jgi:hypothetical protein